MEYIRTRHELQATEPISFTDTVTIGCIGGALLFHSLKLGVPRQEIESGSLQYIAAKSTGQHPHRQTDTDCLEYTAVPPVK